MTPSDLAARAVAIVVSRNHNAQIYASRGCEELDTRFRVLKKLLNSRQSFLKRACIRLHLLKADGGSPMHLYDELIGTIESNQKFAARLDALLSGYFPTKFGQLVTFVVDHWEQLPEAQRLHLPQEGEKWIEPATAAWTEDFRQTMLGELVKSSHVLYLFTNIWLLRRLARQLDPAQLEAVGDFPGLAFPAVLDEEIEEIEIRRSRLDPEFVPTGPFAGKPQERADRENLTGLAFSGGGIRSATFNLGVLQFLGENNLLRNFDYLSTVSGGGYIGSWLHAWIHNSDRAGNARGIDHVEKYLSTKISNPQDDRVAPIRFLRRYSNYLTPQTGPMSADTWTMLNIWLRNSFLNMVILALALSAILLSPQWMAMSAYALYKSEMVDYWWVLMMVPACLIGLNLATFHSHLKLRWVRTWLCQERMIFLLVIAPIFLASWSGGTFAKNDLIPPKLDQDIHKVEERSKRPVGNEAQANEADQATVPVGKDGVAPPNESTAEPAAPSAQTAPAPQAERAVNSPSDDGMEFGLVMAGLVFLVSVTARLDLIFYPVGCRQRSTWRKRLRFTSWAYVKIAFLCVLASIPSGFLAYAVLEFLGPHFTQAKDVDQQMRVMTGSAPIFLGVITIAIFLYMGLLGRRFPDDRREWMARLGGWLAICCVGWVALCGTATYFF